MTSETGSVVGIARQERDLSFRPARGKFYVQTSASTLNKDQSSLTALNVRGLRPR